LLKSAIGGKFHTGSCRQPLLSQIQLQPPSLYLLFINLLYLRGKATCIMYQKGLFVLLSHDVRPFVAHNKLFIQR
jgi:hypothetical protein